MGLKYIVWIAVTLFSIGWNMAIGKTLADETNPYVQTYKAQYGGF